jgi:hypothetical protein
VAGTPLNLSYTFSDPDKDSLQIRYTKIKNATTTFNKGTKTLSVSWTPRDRMLAVILTGW